MMRGLLAWLLIVPKLRFPRFRFGGLNCGVLSKLKTSTRNWTLSRSLVRVFFINEASRLFVPSPRRSGNVRGELPKTNGSGRLKAAVLNQRFGLRWAAGSAAGCPFQFALCPPPIEPVVFGAVMPKG